MARISGMILGLGFLVVFSSLASPASAWDDDDDDGYRRQRKPAYRIDRQPVRIPPRPVEQHSHGPGNYGVPLYPAPPVNTPHRQQGPIVPAPLPPSAFEEGRNYPSQEDYPSQESVPTPAPRVRLPVPQQPGQFVNAAVPLYPLVRVKDQDEAPRFAVHRILAVRSPDPFRFPGCVYVKVCVPPGPCRKVEVKHGGAYIKLEYGDYEVEVASLRGMVIVEYDD